MRAKRETSEVLYATDRIVTMDADAVTELKAEASRNPRGRVRLCAHPNIHDRLHEMLIVHNRDAYVRPHKHVGKSESFHVVEGDVDVVIFDDDGNVTDVIHMGAYGSGRAFYYRIATPIFHTLLIRSEVLVFHEATNGPFDRADTVFAPWGPEDRDTVAVAQFLRGVDERVRRLTA
jgi:cupin fold WbuC family metalloprotein